MSAPIYADPIMDGAADPTVIHREGTNEWWMFYTARRTTHPAPDFAWLHGCAIGVAVSTDDGASWTYRGIVAGLDAPGDVGLNTHWAPEVIRAEGEYHMYLTYMTGAPSRSDGVERHIVHFTSPDLMVWQRIGPIRLNSNVPIDAGIAKCPDGLYRLWYKDEADGSSTWAATSANLYDWAVEGRVIAGKPDANPHEGPNVFVLGGWYWLIVDEWHGLAVHRSTDARQWRRQGIILADPGKDPDDWRFARHADIVPQGDWAALFYFTHPHWAETEIPAPQTVEERQTRVHVARLWVEDGVLRCERDSNGVKLDAAFS